MYPWEILFEDRVRSRGYDYCRNDNITAIKKTKHGYYADAQGMHTYKVAVSFHKGKVNKMHCTCPYAYGGLPCKHEAALLYKLSKDNFQDKQKQHTTINIKEMESLSKDELQTYLLEHAQFDDEIMHPLLDDVVYARNKAIEMVESSFDTYVMPYEDEIDEDFAADFYDEVYDETSKRLRLLIAREKTIEALLLLLSVKQAINSCYVSSYGGEYKELDDMIERELDRIYQQASEAKQEQMLQVVKRLELFRYIDFYSVCKPFYQKVQPHAIKQRQACYDVNFFGIDEEKNRKAYGYALNDAVDCYKEYFKQQQDEASLARFNQLLYQLTLIREKMIIDALEQGKRQEAITILKDSLILDASSKQRVQNYQQALTYLENNEE